MVMCILGIKGYRKDYLRAELKRAWPYVNELEERVKDKLVEIVKMYTGEHTNG